MGKHVFITLSSFAKFLQDVRNCFSQKQYCRRRTELCAAGRDTSGAIAIFFRPKTQRRWRCVCGCKSPALRAAAGWPSAAKPAPLSLALANYKTSAAGSLRDHCLPPSPTKTKCLFHFFSKFLCLGDGETGNVSDRVL